MSLEDHAEEVNHIIERCYHLAVIGPIRVAILTAIQYGFDLAKREQEAPEEST